MHKIKVTDTAKVQALLDAGQGRATARILTPGDIERLAQYGEQRLEALGLAKTYRAGATAHHRPGRVANSYNYRAEGTFATVTRGTSAWYLTDVHRGDTGSQAYGGYSSQSIKLSPEQQIQLINVNELFPDVTALPNSAFADNQVRWRLRQDPKLIGSLRIIEQSMLPQEAAK